MDSHVNRPQLERDSTPKESKMLISWDIRGCCTKLTFCIYLVAYVYMYVYVHVCVRLANDKVSGRRERNCGVCDVCVFVLWFPWLNWTVSVTKIYWEP